MPPVPSGPPPIALTSLSIRNFRGIESLDFDFRGPDGLPNQLVVLAGPNGCGKTAVLEAALLVVGGHALLTGERGKGAIRQGAKKYAIEAEVNRADGVAKIGCTNRKEPPDLRPGIPHWYFSSWRAPRLVGPVDVTLGRPGRKAAKTDANRLKNIKEILVNGAAAESFRSPQYDLLQAAQRARTNRYSSWIESINRSWSKFYPDQERKFLVDLVESDHEGFGSFDVYLTLGNSCRIGVDRLSSGQIEVFLFLAALVLNDDREGIVFIDEPELHLDPQWHAPIVRSLMRLQPRAQFIIATHSPAIYSAANSFERHFLVPEDDPRAELWDDVRGIVAAR